MSYPVTGKKRLKRIQWDLVGRLIIVIRQDPCLRRTNIAMKSGLAYDKCILYLDWMERMDIIRREISADGTQTIRLAEKGHDLYMTEFSELNAQRKQMLVLTRYE